MVPCQEWPHQAPSSSWGRSPGELRGQLPVAAWSPIGGFTDDFGRLMWFAMGDTATIPSPYDHGWVLNRISEVEASPRK